MVIIVVVFMAQPCLGCMEHWPVRHTQGCTPCPWPGHSACCHACFCCPHLAACSGPGHGSRLSELTLAPAACGIVTVPGSFWVAMTLPRLCLPMGCGGAAWAASSVPPTSLSFSDAEGAGQGRGHCLQGLRPWTHVRTSSAVAHPPPQVGASPPFPSARPARHLCHDERDPAVLMLPSSSPHPCDTPHALPYVGGGASPCQQSRLNLRWPPPTSCPPPFPLAMASSRTDGVTLALAQAHDMGGTQKCVLLDPLLGSSF